MVSLEKSSESEQVSESTLRLARIVRTGIQAKEEKELFEVADVDPAAVLECVTEGADVMYRPRTCTRPILHLLVVSGLVECVKACLTTSRDINFSIASAPYHCNVFHLLCCGVRCPEAAVAMLRMMIERLELHPRDTMDWNLTCGANIDFLSLASNRQRLHLFWNVVKEMAFYADQVNPIPILEQLWDWDWEALGTKEQANFVVPENPECRIHASQATGALFALCLETQWDPDPRELEAYVLEGADVCFSNPNRSQYLLREWSYRPEGSILHHLLWKGNVACVAACFRSTCRPINFNLSDPSGRTLLHRLCGDYVDRQRPDRAAVMLQTFLDCIDRDEKRYRDAKLDGTDSVRTSPPVEVDWLQEDSFGDHFFSHATGGQLLSVLWPLVRERVVSYVRHHSATLFPINLHGTVWQWDYENLSEEDRQLFIFDKDLLRTEPRPTVELLMLSLMRDPDPDVVRSVVEAGADVNALNAPEDPLLGWFLMGSSIAAVNAVLSTTSSIDFTMVGSEGWTPLHFLGQSDQKNVVTAEMLRLLVERIESHPEDAIEWDAEDNDGKDFLNLAAGKLSAFWPIVQHLEYFQSAVADGPIQLRNWVCRTDWELLEEMGEQKNFTPGANGWINEDY